MRSTNQILKENWIALSIFVILVVFAIVRFSSERESDPEYTKVEVTDETGNKGKVLRPAKEADIKTKVSTPHLKEPVTTKSVAQAYYWAVRLDGSEGHHIPHLLGMGEPNGQGGYNFVSDSYASTDKPVGRTKNGVYFIKEDLVLKAGMTSYCELKSSEFGWVPKKMVLADIDGERAYVYQP